MAITLAPTIETPTANAPLAIVGIANAASLDSISIDWGDGTTSAGSQSNQHIYPRTGSYTITISATIGENSAKSTTTASVAGPTTDSKRTALYASEEATAKIKQVTYRGALVTYRGKPVVHKADPGATAVGNASASSRLRIVLPPIDQEAQVITEITMAMRRQGVPANHGDRHFRLAIQNGSQTATTIATQSGRIPTDGKWLRFKLPTPIVRRASDTGDFTIEIRPGWTPSASDYIEVKDGNGGDYAALESYNSTTSSWTALTADGSPIIGAIQIWGPRQDVWYLELDTQRDAEYAHPADDLSDRMLTAAHESGISRHLSADLQLDNAIADPSTLVVKITDDDHDFRLDGKAPYNMNHIGSLMRLMRGEQLISQRWLHRVDIPDRGPQQATTTLHANDRSQLIHSQSYHAEYHSMTTVSDAIKELVEKLMPAGAYRRQNYDYDRLDGSFRIDAPSAAGPHKIDDGGAELAMYGTTDHEAQVNGQRQLIELMLHEQLGYLYVDRAGHIQFRNRYWTNPPAPPASSVDLGHASHLDYRRKPLYNHFTLHWTNKRETAEDEILYSFEGSDPIILGPRERKTLRAEYKLPGQDDKRVKLIEARPPDKERRELTATKGQLTVPGNPNELLGGKPDPTSPNENIYRGRRIRGVWTASGEEDNTSVEFLFEFHEDHFEMTAHNLLYGLRDYMAVVGVIITGKAIILDADPSEATELDKLSIARHGKQPAPAQNKPWIHDQETAEKRAQDLLAIFTNEDDFLATATWQIGEAEDLDCAGPELLHLETGGMSWRCRAGQEKAGNML